MGNPVKSKKWVSRDAPGLFLCSPSPLAREGWGWGFWFPPPLRGRVGVGGMKYPRVRPPTPALPRKGGREQSLHVSIGYLKVSSARSAPRER